MSTHKASEHTPGPWTLKFTNNVVGANDRLVANCGAYSTNMDDGRHHEENDANAHLIAAAPDPLEALQVMAKTFDGLSAIHNDAYRLARAAIAKATNK